MPKAASTRTILANADVVWSTIRDGAGLARYLLILESSTVEGHVRTCRTRDGATIVERIDAIDDATRTFRYSMTSAPLPVEKYVSTMRVVPLGEGRCEVEWSATFDVVGAPEDAVVGQFNEIYALGLQGLDALHARPSSRPRS